MTVGLEKNAIIFCRAASRAQGAFCPQMAAQLARCRDHARQSGYEVVRTFREHAAGSKADRPQVNAMLAFLRGWRGEPLTIIVEDGSRLARNVEAYLAIQKAIGDTGAALQLVPPKAPKGVTAYE